MLLSQAGAWALAELGKMSKVHERKMAQERAIKPGDKGLVHPEEDHH